VSESIMKQLSDYLKVELIDVMEVATFYSMINIKPVGKNVISVCNNVSCMLNGSDEIIRHIEKKLKIKVGTSTPDKRFYLKDEVECLAACTGGPMMQVNHVNYENLTKEKVDKILDKIK
jgi:NADH-quinone oxidoreductase subunit E